MTTALIAAAAVFATSTQAAQLHADAQRSTDLDQSLLAATRLENSLSLLVFVAAAVDEGLVSVDQRDDLQEAIAEQFQDLETRLTENGAEALWIESISQAVDDPTPESLATARGQLAQVTADLVDERSFLAGRMAAAGAQQSRAARAASFGVAFLIPLGFMIVYRSSVRRRVRTARMKADLTRQLEVSHAKNEMIGNLSHELRTPLTAIYGLASAVAEAPDDPAFMREVNDLILTEAADLDRMVTDLLTAAKADSDGLVFSPSDTDVAAEVAAAAAPFMKQGIHLSMQIDPSVRAWVDRYRLRHIVQNLLSNAARHGRAPIAVTARTEHDRAILEVIDNGSGVAPEVQERMFERFVHSGDAALVTGSVGIGLSVVNLLVDRMNGTLSYERREGQTVFRVELPAVTATSGHLVNA